MPVAICFYTPEAWNELKKVADDKKNLDDTYTEWLVGFSRLMTNLKGQGIEAVSLKVEVAELQEWCKKKQTQKQPREPR